MVHRSAAPAIRWSPPCSRFCSRSPAEAASFMLRRLLLPAVPFFASAAAAPQYARPNPATVPTVPLRAAVYARSRSGSTSFSLASLCAFSTSASVLLPDTHHFDVGGCRTARRARSHPKTASRARSTWSVECDMMPFLPATRLKPTDKLPESAHWHRKFCAQFQQPGVPNAAKRRGSDRYFTARSEPLAVSAVKSSPNTQSHNPRALPESVGFSSKCHPQQPERTSMAQGRSAQENSNDPDLELEKDLLDGLRRTGIVDSARFTKLLALAEARACWQRLDDLWQLVRAEDLTHTVENFNTMLRSYVTRRSWKHFTDLTERMEMENVQYNAETYRVALLACVKLQNRRNLHFLWHKAAVEEVPLTTEHYNVMLQGCLEAGHMEVVEKLFRTMDEKSLPFDAMTYTWKILFLIEIQRWSQLEKLWSQMKTSGIQPTTAHYNLMLRASQERRNLMKSCLETESWIKLIALWNEMDARGVRRDIHLYNLMFHACVKTSSYEQLDLLWQKMLEEGLQPDEFTYEEIKPRPAIDLLPPKRTYVALEDDVFVEEEPMGTPITTETTVE